MVRYMIYAFRRKKKIDIKINKFVFVNTVILSSQDFSQMTNVILKFISWSNSSLIYLKETWKDRDLIRHVLSPEK